MNFLEELEQLLYTRKHELPEGSYSTSLFKGGEDRILKKIGEEAGEVIIAAKNSDRKEITHEAADLIFHLIMILVHKGIPLMEIEQELIKRHKK
ncbi:MAG: phosphoribosyl-ATP diphosphatase [Leptospirales bacterium]|nr:phosphoribosyl-ATP diphosphatase [Leptospirales bacterium]